MAPHNTMHTLLAIDGNSIMNRAFYGVHSALSSRDGFPTNALYGFLNMTAKLLDEYHPDYRIAAFDVHAPTFRHKAYAEYKAGRHETPEDLLKQLEVIDDFLLALGFTVLRKEGYEADDILGTLSEMAEQAETPTQALIYTGDRDSLQLISDRTTVLLATNGGTVPYTRDLFRKEKGIDPTQFVDVKALMGDSSDNIPGVPGVGEKTAFALIQRFGSLDELYASLDTVTDLKPRTVQLLRDGRDSAYKSRLLSAIERHVPLTESLSSMRFTGIRESGLQDLLNRYDFTSFRTAFSRSGTPGQEIAPAEPAPEFETVDPERLNGIPEQTVCALALAPDSVELAFEERNWRLPVNGETRKVVLERVLSRPFTFLIQDCKEFYKAMDRIGIRFRSCAFDPMLGAYVLDSSSGKYALPDLVSAYLGTDWSEDYPQSVYILKLYREITSKLSQTRQIQILNDIEMPLAAVLADMEETGFKVDLTRLHDFGLRLEAKEKELTEECYALAGTEFNLNSPKQLGEILFERMNLPSLKKTKSGYSTNAEVLAKLRPYSPIIDKILDYRTVSKLRSVYAEGLQKEADGNGRIHTTFRQTGTATGRLSSAEPNLQNIPIRTEIGKEFRKFFIPLEPDHVLIDADYSQIELRLLANLSGDETMIRAFQSDADIHTATAAHVFGIPEDEVTPDLRKRAKAVNFGILYGIGAFSLSEDLGISRAAASDFIEQYYRTYPDIKEYLETVVQAAVKEGYVTTLFGRRRYIAELKASNRMVVAAGERIARNSPIQGSAADLIKIAMIRVDRELRSRGLNARMILQVHDELILDADRSCAEEARKLLKETMESVLDLPVRFLADAQIGDTWFDCHS
ncbi:MAG: DNA polymerase I [Clostridia bacterium]|nr:DNA polymerase I [Clostridia bacterium]